MSEDKLNKIFSESECISLDTMYRYRNDSLGHSENHLIETHLSNCEMCTEVLEQLSDNDDGVYEEITASVNEKVAKSINEKPGTGIYAGFMKYASIAALLVVVLIFIVNMYHKNADTDQLAESGSQEIKGIEQAPVKEPYDEPAPKEIIKYKEVTKDQITEGTDEGTGQPGWEERGLATDSVDHMEKGSIDDIRPDGDVSAAPRLIASVEILKVEMLDNSRSSSSTNKKIGRSKKSNTGYAPGFEEDNEAPPKFKGGEIRLKEYFRKNIDLPVLQDVDNAQRTAKVVLVINYSGEVVEYEIEEGVDNKLKAQLVRAIENMPLWGPGTISVRYHLSIKL